GLEFAGGEVFLNGEDLLTLSPLEQRNIRGHKVAYLAQSAAATFNPAITIGEQVTESAVLHGVLTQEQATKRAVELYHALELPDPNRIGFRYPHQVSGGQLQRLMAAMALCGKPDLLVLDEPTTALDVTTQIEVLKAFKKVIREENAAAIYVTHDLAVVAQVADHITVLYSGEVMEEGTVDQIINHPTHEYTKRLMAAVSKGAEAREKADAKVEAKAEEPASDKKPAMEVIDMTAGYGKMINGLPMATILRDIDVVAGHAEVIGVIGESGCGKSTLAKVMAGMLPQAKGEVKLNGKLLQGDLRKRELDELRRVQFVFQMADTALNPKQLIGEILGRPLEFYRGIKGKEKQGKVNELLEMVELPLIFADRYPSELSGGQKQRVNLARHLAAEPDVMLCDEVTSALDSIVADNVIQLLRKLRDKTGVSFVFITHDLSTIAAFADKMVVLYAGRVVEQGPVDLVMKPPYHPYTRLLITSVPELRIGWLEDTMQKREMAAGIARGVEITAIGCPFYNRCPMAIDGVCDVEVAPEREDTPGHIVACHLTIDELNDAAQEAQKILHGFEKAGGEAEEYEKVTAH
ncbi:MAG: ATP-binding cassette domain-containing protein, partial [Proteobacteria bacterium]|nr:ATP-binding cassette domain-containing protein [Pseudomonadota bacterium]